MNWNRFGKIKIRWYQHSKKKMNLSRLLSNKFLFMANSLIKWLHPVHSSNKWTECNDGMNALSAIILWLHSNSFWKPWKRKLHSTENLLKDAMTQKDEMETNKRHEKYRKEAAKGLRGFSNWYLLDGALNQSASQSQNDFKVSLFESRSAVKQLEKSLQAQITIPRRNRKKNHQRKKLHQRNQHQRNLPKGLFQPMHSMIDWF